MPQQVQVPALPIVPMPGSAASTVRDDARPMQEMWWWSQLFVPLCLFAIANLVLIVLGGDRWIADHVYAWEGGRWALKHSYLNDALIHGIGKRLMALAWLVLIVWTVVAYRKPSMQAWRWPMLRLTLSVLLATVTVTLLKHVTHMDCPWDLQAYGGTHPYISLFTARPAGLKTSGCFPAGHASGGYAWVALYFFFLQMRPAWRWLGLGVGIGIGLVFGISQELRGAHFLSHDLWTLMICWLVALLMYRATAYGRIAAGVHRRIRAGRLRQDTMTHT